MGELLSGSVRREAAPLPVTVGFSPHAAILSKQTGHHSSTGAPKPRCLLSILRSQSSSPPPLLPILTVGAPFGSRQHYLPVLLSPNGDFHALQQNGHSFILGAGLGGWNSLSTSSTG